MKNCVISADSHFLEPPTLWQERLDRKYRDRAPHTVVSKRRGIVLLVGEDIQAQPVSGWCAAGRAAEDAVKINTLGFDAAPPGVWTPEGRIKDQDRDGIAAEILYTSFGMVAMNIRDSELAMACMRVFNDYAAEFCSHDPKRLIGIGAVVPDDVEACVREMERIGKLGLRGVMLPITLVEGESYGNPKYDPIWAAAQEMDLVLSFHAGTSRAGINPRPEDWAQLYMSAHYMMQRPLTDVIVGGVFDRFPGLKLVSVENDVSWLPSYVERLEHFADRFVAVASLRLKKRPTEYIRDHVFATFTFEGPGVDAVRRAFGCENIMWGNDYPHLDSSWPNSRELIQRSLIDVLPPEDAENILCNNVARLYELELPQQAGLTAAE